MNTRSLLIFLALCPSIQIACLDGSPPGSSLQPTVEAIEAVLNDFHKAASDADVDRYLGHFSQTGVFLGTDASERWTREQFREFVRPYFSRGQGWIYTPRERHVTISANGRFAWFDEILENSAYGTCRGSGALRLVDGAWKIEQYSLSIPIPNDLTSDLVARIRESLTAQP